MKKLLLLPLLSAILITGLIFWFYNSAKPVSTDISLKDFLIVRGSSASQVGASLEKSGLVRNSTAFKLYIQLTGKQSKIQAGEYLLSPSFSLFKIVEEFGRGPVEVWVTIPEGLRREEIAGRFADTFGQGGNFVGEFLDTSRGQEGFLFPDTYLFPKTASASAVAKKMAAIFNMEIDSKMRKDIDASGHNLEEITTMASIIERETKTSEERPVVSGILYNRLKIGMPLQVDATVQYAVANVKCSLQDKQMSSVKCEWWPQTTNDDRSIKSLYNTYKYTGLPPAPIANPGLSSLKAAIYPTESEYFYYLHDAKGQIHYAKTLEEHNRNINDYLEK